MIARIPRFETTNEVRGDEATQILLASVLRQLVSEHAAVLGMDFHSHSLGSSRELGEVDALTKRNAALKNR